MHEIQRSPYASPSRSPRRSSKCLRNKTLRMARRSISTRAKHRVGLERPHFWSRFRGQSETRGRSSPRRESFRCFARVFRRILRRNMCRRWVNKVKEVMITLCTFRIADSFTRAMTTSEKVAEKERSKWVGATPGNLWADRPEKSWGAAARLRTLRR